MSDRPSRLDVIEQRSRSHVAEYLPQTCYESSSRDGVCECDAKADIAWLIEEIKRLGDELAREQARVDWWVVRAG